MPESVGKNHPQYGIVYDLKFDIKEGILPGNVIIGTSDDISAFIAKSGHRLKNISDYGTNRKMEQITSEITLATKNIVEANQMQSFYNRFAASGLDRLHANLNID